MKKKKIGAMKDEMNQLKVIISYIGNQILIKNQNLECINKRNVQEIVEIAVKTPDNSKVSVKPSKEEKYSKLPVHCDYCGFNCENENLTIAHMDKEHEKRHFCDLGGRYLKYHNNATHNENYSESEVT